MCLNFTNVYSCLNMPHFDYCLFMPQCASLFQFDPLLLICICTPIESSFPVCTIFSNAYLYPSVLHFSDVNPILLMYICILNIPHSPNVSLSVLNFVERKLEDSMLFVLHSFFKKICILYLTLLFLPTANIRPKWADTPSNVLLKIIS